MRTLPLLLVLGAMLTSASCSTLQPPKQSPPTVAPLSTPTPTSTSEIEAVPCATLTLFRPSIKDTDGTKEQAIILNHLLKARCGLK